MGVQHEGPVQIRESLNEEAAWGWDHPREHDQEDLPLLRSALNPRRGTDREQDGSVHSEPVLQVERPILYRSWFLKTCRPNNMQRQSATTGLGESEQHLL